MDPIANIHEGPLVEARRADPGPQRRRVSAGLCTVSLRAGHRDKHSVGVGLVDVLMFDGVKFGWMRVEGSWRSEWMEPVPLSSTVYGFHTV